MKKNTVKRTTIFLLAYLFGSFILVYAQLQVPVASKEELPTNLISLDLKEVELKDTLKIIAQASGLNIVLDKDVKAKVNISLKDVPWQLALDNILKTNELTYRIQDNIIRVMTLSTVKKEEETVPLTTKIIRPNFAKAEDLQNSLTKMLSLRGSMQVNVSTNSIIINDTPEALLKIEGLVNKLDIRTPQVMIEAFIMSVKLTDTDKFGIDWTATHKKHGSTAEGKRALSQSLKAADKTLELYYGKSILPNWVFTAQMNLYAQDKRVKILANPRILTLDNLSAQIEITEQAPYTYVSQSTEGTTSISSTQFKDVGIKLYVTPHITKDRFISLSVKAEQSYIASYVGSTNEPAIDSRKAETNLILKDGETFVIGGLRKKDNTVTIDKIPLLGDIPFLGKFFRKEVKEVSETELLIFVTPHIVEEAIVFAKEEEKFEKSKEELFGIKKERNKAISKTLAQLWQEEKLTRKIELKEQGEEKARQQELEAAAQEERQKQERLEKEIDARLEKEIATLYQEAINYYEHNQFPEAEHTFEQILILDPNETKAREYLEIKIPQKKKN